MVTNTIVDLKQWLNQSKSFNKRSVIRAINQLVSDQPSKNLLTLVVNSGVFQKFFENRSPSKNFIQIQHSYLMDINLWPTDTAQYAINKCLELFSREEKVLFKIKIDGKWAFMNNHGQTIISPKWHKISNYFNNRAIYNSGIDEWTVIDDLGEILFKASYTFVGSFKQNLSIVNLGGRIENKKIIEGKFGVINTYGFEILPCIYDFVGNFNAKGLSIVKKSGLYGIVDSSGKIVVDLIYKELQPFSEELAAVKNDDLWGYLDEHGSLIIGFQYDLCRPFKNQLAAVKKDGKWGYINHLGEIVVKFKYDFIGNFTEGLCWTNVGGTLDNKRVKGGKWGFTSRLNEVVPPEFDWVSNFNGGLAPARLGKRWFYIDLEGNIAFSPKSAINITPFTENVAWVKKRKGYNLIDSKNNILIEDEDIIEIAPFKNGLCLLKKDGIDIETNEDEWGANSYEVPITYYQLTDKENNHIAYSASGITDMGNNFYKVHQKESIGIGYKHVYHLFHGTKEIIKRNNACDFIYRPVNGLILVQKDFKYWHIDYNGNTVGPSWIEAKEREEHYSWLAEMTINNEEDDY